MAEAMGRKKKGCVALSFFAWASSVRTAGFAMVVVGVGEPVLAKSDWDGTECPLVRGTKPNRGAAHS